MKPTALIFSAKLRALANLESFIPEWQIIATKQARKTSSQAVIGWGYRPTTHKARLYAKQKQIPYLALEDGFIRSVGLGVQNARPLSLIYDDIGMYYATTAPSRLEELILNSEFTPEQEQQAKTTLDLILQTNISKYNHAPFFHPTLEQLKLGLEILVIDQTKGDISISAGQATSEDFQKMLDTALAENPEATIWIKTHPDVFYGTKQGYLTDLPHHPRIKLLSVDCNPLSLLRFFNKVYCVTSQMGFEGVMLGKEVHTFGIPWYSGWGLTNDRNNKITTLEKQKRRTPRSIEQVFTAAYIQYPRYINPYTGRQGTILEVLPYLAQMQQTNQLLAGKVYAVGFSWWKQRFLRNFFNFPSCKLQFITSTQAYALIQRNSSHKLILWGLKETKLETQAKERGWQVLRIEDGFIRSLGLGSNLVKPLSLVLDNQGIYFNPRCTSRLEQLLQCPQQLALARNLLNAQGFASEQELLKQLRALKISKYNVGVEGIINFKHSNCINIQGNIALEQRKRLLVVGQVADDASIKSGCYTLRDNLSLLKEVRRLNPEAFIIYKPHPDVVSKNRKGAISLATCFQYADQVITDFSISSCIEQVEQVHTLTSLAGFEALIAGKEVYCYGVPFYSGWGLTHDINYPEEVKKRRSCQLSLETLVLTTLILYPLYLHPISNNYTSLSQILTSLCQAQTMQIQQPIYRSWLAKQWYKCTKVLTLAYQNIKQPPLLP